MINYNAPIQTFGRQTAGVAYKQQVRRQQTDEHSVSVAVWKAFGKLMLVTLPILFTVNLCLSLYQGRIGSSIVGAEEARFDLMNTNITLRAKKAFLMSPEYIQTVAADKLALYVPKKNQIKHL